MKNAKWLKVLGIVLLFIVFNFIVTPFYIPGDKLIERLSHISNNAGNFYRIMSCNTNTGKMILGGILSDIGIDLSERLRYNVTKENINNYSKQKYSDNNHIPTQVSQEMETKEVPIITYHHIEPNADNSNSAIVSPKKFKEDMLSLKKAGFKTIFLKDLANYTEGIQPLPHKPLIITLDDGYLSNYKYAYPILKELNMKATILVIGKYVGHPGREIKGKKIFPHFTWKQAKEMYDSGHIDIQSHSFNMHNPSEEEYPFRKGVFQRKDESIKDYIKFFKADCIRQKELIESNIDNQVIAFSYPYGYYNELSEELLSDLGYKITLTIDKGINLISKNKDSLFKLKRINVDHNLPSRKLVELLKY